MPINFIPNDPLSVDLVPMRAITPRSNRPANRAGFTISGTTPPQQLYQPGTGNFVVWQAREAVLAALEVFEALSGQPFKRWKSAVKIKLVPDGGVDLNAYY